MQIEIQEPEVGQRFTQQMQSGQFRDTDELLSKALDDIEITLPTSPELEMPGSFISVEASCLPSPLNERLAERRVETR